MATKSITKNVVIRERSQCTALLRALEGSASTKSHKVVYQRPHSEMSAEDMKKIFGGSNDRVSRS